MAETCKCFSEVSHINEDENSTRGLLYIVCYFKQVTTSQGQPKVLIIAKILSFAYLLLREFSQNVELLNLDSQNVWYSLLKQKIPKLLMIWTGTEVLFLEKTLKVIQLGCWNQNNILVPFPLYIILLVWVSIQDFF